MINLYQRWMKPQPHDHPFGSTSDWAIEAGWAFVLGANLVSGGGGGGGGGKEHNSTLGGSAGHGLKCPRILYINLSDKMACVDSEDPDQMFLRSRGHPRGRFGRKSLPNLADFSLSWAGGEVKMYRMYREIQNLDQNFSLKSWICRKTSPSLKALGWPLKEQCEIWFYTVKLHTKYFVE